MSPDTLAPSTYPLALVGGLTAAVRPLAARVARWFAGLLVPRVLAGCSTVNPYYDPSRPHHRPDRFNNLHVDNWRADAPSFWQWVRERRVADLPADEPQRAMWDRNVTLWGGFVVEATVDGQAFRLLFAGDTGYFPDFKMLGKRFNAFDFAAIYRHR